MDGWIRKWMNEEDMTSALCNVMYVADQSQRTIRTVLGQVLEPVGFFDPQLYARCVPPTVLVPPRIDAVCCCCWTLDYCYYYYNHCNLQHQSSWLLLLLFSCRDGDVGHSYAVLFVLIQLQVHAVITHVFEGVSPRLAPFGSPCSASSNDQNFGGLVEFRSKIQKAGVD
jgi:hypothetical protein